MKTTNYEISKKLAEIGFRAETGFYWYEYDEQQEMRYIADADGAGKYKAYDLETILEALPKGIRKENDFVAKLRIFFDEEGDNLDGSTYIGYQTYEGFISKFTKEQGVNESLVDCAARLLIKLVEDGIVNFKKI